MKLLFHAAEEMILLSKIFKASEIVFSDKQLLELQNDDKIENEIKKPIDKPNKEDTNLVAFKIMERARKEAAKIISSANIDAEIILEKYRKEAKFESVRIKELAKEEGFAEGHKEGILELEKLRADAEKHIQEIKEKKESIYQELEPEILDLIISITDKLLNKAVEINPDIVLNLIRQGLNETTLSGEINIRVSPQRYDFVVKNKDKILMDNRSKFEIIRDLSLKDSDCIIETSFGNIDCSLDEQFKLLKENLYMLLK